MAEQMGQRRLWEPILNQDIPNPHFFNGRLLTALALQEVQNANRQQHRQLGKAIGAGVAYGLQVSLMDDGSGGGTPVVSVAPGLAINPAGQPLDLPSRVDVRLELPGEPPPAEAGLFKTCEPLENGLAPPGKGAYVLAVRPASGYHGFVPRVRFSDNGRGEGCGRRYALEGVQFHLEELPVSMMRGLSQDTRNDLDALVQDIDELRFRPDAAGVAERRAKLSRLRNWLAHACLGTEEVARFARDPFRQTNGQPFYANYGAVDALRTAGSLTDCDVPLALIYWKNDGVHFVDMWSVRRQLVPPSRSTVWPLATDERRMAEGEAAFLQFQEQMNDLLQSNLSQSVLASIRAIDYARYLPAAGLVALGRRSFPGFSVAGFFGGQPHREPEFTGGAGLCALLKEAMTYECIDLAAGELVWLYKPWQNRKGIDDGEANLQPFVVFTSGHMPHKAIARFDLARWEYSNYAK